MNADGTQSHPMANVPAVLPHNPPDAALLGILGRLQRDAEMIGGRTADLVLDGIPAYRDIPRQEVHDQVVENTRRAVKSLREGRVPRAQDVPEAAIAAKRASQGVPVQDVLLAYRISLGIIRDQFLLLAAECDAPTEVVVKGIQLLWETTDVVTLQLAVRHQDAEVQAARKDERQRLDFLRRLLTGSMSATELRSRAPRYGLSPDRPYVTIRAHAEDDALLASLKRLVESSAEDTPYLLGLVDGDLAAVALRAPEVGTLPVTVGLGYAAGLAEVPLAWDAASRTLATARAFGVVGVHNLEDLSLRSAVASEHEVGAMLVDRYLSPLADEENFGVQLEQSVRSFLSYGMNITRAARALVVHPNTLRHRLHRFEEMTGANFEDPRTVVEVWWALERRTWLRHQICQQSGAERPRRASAQLQAGAQRYDAGDCPDSGDHPDKGAVGPGGLAGVAGRPPP